MGIFFGNIILSLSWAIISFIFVFASFVSNIARCLLLIDEFLNNIPYASPPLHSAIRHFIFSFYIFRMPPPPLPHFTYHVLLVLFQSSYPRSVRSTSLSPPFSSLYLLLPFSVCFFLSGCNFYTITSSVLLFCSLPLCVSCRSLCSLRNLR